MRAPRFWWEKAGLASTLLAPLGSIYGAVAGRRLAQNGAHAGIPVICVGNPTLGGAGKTPTAVTVARLLMAVGERPMFLTRGYGGKLAGPVMVTAAHPAVEVGDEPLLLARIARTADIKDEPRETARPGLHRDARQLLQGLHGVGLGEQAQRVTVVSLHGDVCTAGADIQGQVAVDVGDVEQPFQEVRGDVALLLQLRDGRLTLRG